MATLEIIDLTTPTADHPTHASPTTSTITHPGKDAEGSSGNTLNLNANSNANSKISNESLYHGSSFALNAMDDGESMPKIAIEREVVEVSRTPAPRRTRKRAKKSPVSGVQEEKEEKAEVTKEGGGTKEDASESVKEEKVGEKRKRDADDDGDGDGSPSGSALEEGEMVDTKMDVVEVESEAQVPTQRERERDKQRGSEASVKPKSKSKQESRAKAKAQSKQESKSKREVEPQSQSTARTEPTSQPEAESDLFFIDVTPTAVPTVLVDNTPAVAVEIEAEPVNTKLLVPAHVTVLGSTPVEIIEKPTAEEGEDGEADEDYIDYLDYDDARGITRYFENPPDPAAALSRTVCKNCGAEGDHKTSACTVQICLTCGARNEHSTRSCPITKVCFTCGMKGHINAQCPNRRSGRAMMSTRDQECDRCYSSFHKTNECPTWWRIYEYFSTEGQLETLARRLSKKGMLLGKGGEAYIADDEWCYNCGSAGHWGDDCDDARVPPNDYSAFSSYNAMKSPFYDPTEEKQNKSKSATKRHIDDYNQWPSDAPDQVGRKARVKARLALQKHVEKVDEDEDDWFGNRGSKKNVGVALPPKGAPTEPKKMRFGFSLDAKSKGDQGSLLARLEVPSGNDFPRNEKKDDRGKSSDKRSDRHRGSGSGSDKKKDRYSDKDKSRYRDRREGWRDEGRGGSRGDEMRNGRRYTGGYAR